jgi:hypothetical protein
VRQHVGQIRAKVPRLNSDDLREFLDDDKGKEVAAEIRSVESVLASRRPFFIVGRTLMNRRRSRKNHMRSLRHSSRKLLNSFANYQQE